MMTVGRKDWVSETSKLFYTLAQPVKTHCEIYPKRSGKQWPFTNEH
jgi:hypothetical protein